MPTDEPFDDCEVSAPTQTFVVSSQPPKRYPKAYASSAEYLSASSRCMFSRILSK